MSSTSHLFVAQAKEAKTNKGHSNINLEITPCDNSSNLSHLSTPPPNLNYLYYVNTDPKRKQSFTTVTHTLTPTSSVPETSSNVRRKLSAISLPVPWHKRNRSPSESKASTDSIPKQTEHHQHHRKSHHFLKMSRDRLLTLDRLFNSTTHTSGTINDDEPPSPITEVSALDDSMRSSDKVIKSVKENGYLHNPPRIITR